MLKWVKTWTLSSLSEHQIISKTYALCFNYKLMKKIFSKIYPNRLLHILVKPHDLKKNINEITDHSKLLQCIGLKLQKGKKFESHKHKKIFQLKSL